MVGRRMVVFGMGKPEDVDDAVRAYVVERLRKECGVRTVAATISRETGLTQTTISNVVQGKRGVGWDSVRKLARYWNLTMDELERLALQVAKEREPREQRERRRIRDRAEWAVELERVRLTREGPELEEYFQQIGDMIDTLPHDIDAIGLLELAQSLRGIAKRALAHGANDAGKNRR